MSVATPPSPAEAAGPTIPSLRRRLLSAGFWSFAGRGAAIGIFFLTDMALARALSKTEFASMYLATSVTTFMAGVASLGTHQILSRVVRQTIYGPHPERTEGVIRACTTILTVGCVLGTAAFMLGVPHFIGAGAQWAPFREFPWGIAAWGCLSSGCLNSAFALQGLDDFRSASLIGSRRGGVLPNVAFLVFTLIAWQLGAINVTTLIYAQIVFQAATLLVARRAIQKRLDHFAPPEARHQALAESEGERSAFWYLRESLPFWVSLLTTMAIDELDGLFVGWFAHGASVADYGAGRRLVRLMSTPFVMFAASMGPFVAELVAKGEKQKLERISRASATFVALPMLAVFAAYILCPKLILWLAFGKKFAEGDAAMLLQLMTLGQVAFVLLGNSGQTLLMAGKQMSLMVASLATLAVYCVLAPWMMGRWGAAGGAALQSIIVAGQAVIVTLLAKKHVGIWTVATFKRSDLVDAARALVGRRKKKPQEPPSDAAELEAQIESLPTDADAGG